MYTLRPMTLGLQVYISGKPPMPVYYNYYIYISFHGRIKVENRAIHYFNCMPNPTRSFVTGLDKSWFSCTHIVRNTLTNSSGRNW